MTLQDRRLSSRGQRPIKLLSKPKQTFAPRIYLTRHLEHENTFYISAIVPMSDNVSKKEVYTF